MTRGNLSAYKEERVVFMFLLSDLVFVELLFFFVFLRSPSAVVAQ